MNRVSYLAASAADFGPNLKAHESVSYKVDGILEMLWIGLIARILAILAIYGVFVGILERRSLPAFDRFQRPVQTPVGKARASRRDGRVA